MLCFTGICHILDMPFLTCACAVFYSTFGCSTFTSISGMYLTLGTWCSTLQPVGCLGLSSCQMFFKFHILQVQYLLGFHGSRYFSFKNHESMLLHFQLYMVFARKTLYRGAYKQHQHYESCAHSDVVLSVVSTSVFRFCWYF